ncbi:copper resistance protein CopC, partial [Microbacterium sp.]|uniref:copper resistance CopC family protein n=1 Tax=Microbacterium sp. TaxID=51671 RepID=UPI00273638D7
MATAATIVLGLTVALAHATSAAGHEALAASSPGAGDVLESGPSEIVLTFSGQLLEDGAAVAVSDSGSRDWVTDSPTVDGATATTVLDSA